MASFHLPSRFRQWIWCVPVLVVAWLAFHWSQTDSALPGPENYSATPETLETDISSTQSGYGGVNRRSKGVLSIFAATYPATPRLQEELRYVTATGKLRDDNKLLIERAIVASSERFRMPPSVLWCLLFQESRFNHLEGIADRSGSRGLGQFSSFGFYEVNHQLDKFYSGSSRTWIELLGKEVRPISATTDNLNDPSSYFYIPTAVISSATYLNNRYLHLARLLSRQQITYDPQVLWLHAAMAYNKGTRSVLATWKEARRHRRRVSEKLMVDPKVFLSSMGSTDLLSRALMRIWSPSKAEAYAREAGRHLSIIGECSLSEGGQP